MILIFAAIAFVDAFANANAEIVTPHSFMYYDQNDTMEYLITDRDPYTQNVIQTLDFTALTQKPLYQWGSEGYNTVTLTFYFWAKEIDKGYQKIYIYPTTGSSNMIDEIEFELAGTSLCREYIYCQYVLGMTMNDCLASDSLLERLYVRFGAHGSNDDDWKFYGMSIKITLS